MQMRKRILAIVLPFLVICACKTAKKTATDAPNTALVIKDELFRKPITDKELYRETTEMVPLDSVYIAKDTLNIITKKITGCDAENFKLIWTGDLGKAIPAQTGVKLLQYVAADCKEKHKFHLTYNISPLKLKNDTSAVKTTLIRVGGWPKMTNYIHN
jgi:hypothetical protein